MPPKASQPSAADPPHSDTAVPHSGIMLPIPMTPGPIPTATEGLDQLPDTQPALSGDESSWASEAPANVLDRMFCGKGPTPPCSGKLATIHELTNEYVVAIVAFVVCS